MKISLCGSILAGIWFANGFHRAVAVCSSTDTNSITEIVCNSSTQPTLTRLCLLLQQTNLASQISRSSDYYLFAPNNYAFQRAGRTAGVTSSQVSNTLLYHVSNDATALACGSTRNSLLTVGGTVQQTSTSCDSNSTPMRQLGNVLVPSPLSGPASFVGTEINACNGRIRIVDAVLGFSEVIYTYGRQGHVGKGAKKGKGAKGQAYAPPPPAQTQTNQGYSSYQNTSYTKSNKGGKSSSWSTNSQPTYNNNNNNSPYTTSNNTPMTNSLLLGSYTYGQSGGLRGRTPYYNTKAYKSYKYGKRERYRKLLESENEASSPYLPLDVR